MGKKGGGSPPKAPDPVRTIEAQKAADKQALKYSAFLNAVDIFGPTGSTTYQKRPDGTPKAQITTLSPEQQQLYNRQMQIGNRLADLAFGQTNNIPTDQFSLGGLPYDPTSYNLDNVFQTFQPVSFPRDMSQVGAPPPGGPGAGGGKGGDGGQVPPGGQAPPQQGGGFGQSTPMPVAPPSASDAELRNMYDLVGADVQSAAQQQLQQYNQMVEQARQDAAIAPNKTTVGDLFQGYYEGRRGGEYLGDGGAEVATPRYSREYDTYRFQLKDPSATYENMQIINPGGDNPFSRGPQKYTLDEFLALRPEDRSAVNNWKVKYSGGSTNFDPSSVEYNWQAPSGFDSTYYANQVGLQPGQNAWQHYVTNNLGSTNFRPAYPSPTTQAQLAQMLAQQGS
jgi:hypothetical protein